MALRVLLLIATTTLVGCAAPCECGRQTVVRWVYLPAPVPAAVTAPVETATRTVVVEHCPPESVELQACDGPTCPERPSGVAPELRLVTDGP